MLVAATRSEVSTSVFSCLALSIVSLTTGCPTTPDSPASVVVHAVAPGASARGAVLLHEQVNATGGVFSGRPLELRVVDDVASLDGEETLVLSVGDDDAVDLAARASSTLLHVSASSVDGAIATDADPFTFATANAAAEAGTAYGQLLGAGAVVDDVSVAACPQAVVFVDGDAGEAFADRFAERFVARGGRVPSGWRLSTADGWDAFADALAVPDAAADLCVVVDVADDVSTAPTSVVAALQNRSGPTTLVVSTRTSVHTVLVGAMSDAVDVAYALVAGVDDTDGLARFQQAFDARFAAAPTPQDAHLYDAALLVAAGLATSNNPAPAAVRDAFYEVSNDGVVVDGTSFAALKAALANGDDVDITGASGALDVDDDGHIGAPFALQQWNGTGWTSVATLTPDDWQ